ncbi:MAG: GNAT family N-acetyltransferase [Marinilabiliales bacterium]|nr:MAG: GNAT family N-acetyltransferase [Marinilabiliales bacterium]
MDDSKLTLRSFELADAEHIALLANNKSIWINLRDAFPYPYSQEDAVQFIEKCQKMNPQSVFAIIYNNELCGSIGIFQMQDVYRKSAEIGYWIGEQYWGKGIASKAVEKIVQYGFANMDIVKIFAGIFSNNMASHRVLEKNGFVKEAVLKNAVFKNGKLLDEHRYSLLKS